MCKQMVKVIVGRRDQFVKRLCKKQPLKPIAIHHGYCAIHSPQRIEYAAIRQSAWSRNRDNDRWVGKFLRQNPNLQGTYFEILAEIAVLEKSFEIHDLNAICQYDRRSRGLS